MILSFVVLIAALAEVVYKETPGGNQTPYENSSNLADVLPAPSSTGNLLGGMTNGQESYIDPIIGSWQEPAGMIYTFDSSRCSINYDSSASSAYSTRTATVILHSGAPYTTTLYVCDQDPDGGFAFVDDKLYCILNENGRCKVWYELACPYHPTLIIGTWKHNYVVDDGYRVIFNDTHCLTLTSYNPPIVTTYTKIGANVRDYYYDRDDRKYYYNEYNLPVYRLSKTGSCVWGYCFIGG